MMESKSILPPAIYWLDLIGMKRVLNFASWQGQHRKTVKVLKRKERRFDDHWVLFRVSKPTKRWAISYKLGLPTIAKKGAATSEKSTIKRGKVKSTTELLTDWGGTVTDALQTGFALLALAYFFGNRRR